MSPFEYAGLSRKERSGKKELSFDEAYLDSQSDDSRVLEDERDNVNYRMIGLILLIGFLALFGRLYLLQGVKGEEYRALAEGNKSRRQFMIAPRGLIVDAYDKVIVGNIPSFELVVVPGDLPDNPGELDSKLLELSLITGKDKQEMVTMLEKVNHETFQPQTLAQNISKDAALTIMARENEFKGFAVQNNPIRDYKDPFIFSHLVGYTGKITEDELSERPNMNYLLNDYIGKTGLEATYEEYLRGKPGERPTEIDAQGNFKKNLPEIAAVPGNNIRLNIDYELQKVLSDSLIATMTKYRKTKAAAVAMDPKTGKILALVSLPGFDNNWFARGISGNEYSSLLQDESIPLLNRVIGGTYPPGSTVKPMLALAALTEGVVEPNTKILDDGVIRVGSYSYYGYNRSGLGPMDVYSAIARSSDIYFYTVGGGNAGTGITGLGPEKLAEWYRKFHLGAALGLDMPHEKPGLVPDPEWKQRTRNEPWYLGNTYHYSIGQGDLLVTPLQVNSWTATIANNGKTMKPYILDEVTDNQGQVQHKAQPEVLSEGVFDSKWLKVVQDGMRQTVTAGSAPSLKTLPIAVSGKTGTAQIINGNLTHTHAWFTSYAPSENPQIALTVLIEEGGEGSTVSVPITKEVYAWWAEHRFNK